MVRTFGGLLGVVGALALTIALVWLTWFTAPSGEAVGWGAAGSRLAEALPAPARGASPLQDWVYTLVHPGAGVVALVVAIPALTCGFRSRRVCRKIAWWHGVVALVALAGVVAANAGVGPDGIDQLVLIVILGAVALLHLFLVFLQLDSAGRYLHPVLLLVCAGAGGTIAYALVDVMNRLPTWRVEPGAWVAVGGLGAMAMAYALTLRAGGEDDATIVPAAPGEGLWDAAASRRQTVNPPASATPPVTQPPHASGQSSAPADS